MSEKKFATVFALIIVLGMVIPAFAALSAPSVSSFEVKIPGESPVYSGDMPVIVRGLIHNMSFDMSSPIEGNITLRARYGTSSTASFNDTTEYEWSFDSATGKWADDLYGRYILPDECGVYGDIISFHVGLSTSAYVGEWNISLYVDGDLIYSTSVSVRDYVLGLAIQSVNTVFTVSPFSSESKRAEYHVRVENKGNIPLKLSVLFGEYQTLFTVTNISEPLHVGEKRDLYITLNSIPWSPRVVNITGTVHPAVPEYLVSPGTVSFATTADQTFNLRIEVVRQGYTLIRVGNIMIQYRESIAANYGDAVSVDMYLSSVNSSGNAQVEISADLLVIDSVRVNNESSSQELSLQLTNDTETHLQVVVTPEKASTTAYLNYDIRDTLTAERKVVRTEIVVGMAIVPDDRDGMVLLILISIVILFIISIIFITFIHFRKERQRKGAHASSKRNLRRRKM